MATLEELKAELARRDAKASAVVIEPINPAADESVLSAGLISAGKGFSDILSLGERAFNAASGNDAANIELTKKRKREEELFKPLQTAFPTTTLIGEIAGESAAALPFGISAGGLAAGGAAKVLTSQLAPRLIGSGVGGAVEGGIVGAVEDEAAGGAAVGGFAAVGAELLMPKLGGIIKKIFKNPDISIENIIQVDGGNLTPSVELDEALKNVGLSFDDITEQAVRDLPQDANAVQVARSQLFEAEGVPVAAKSRITQDPDDFQRELQLARQRSVGQSDKAIIDDFRAGFFDESEAIQRNLNSFSEALGDSSNAGSVKSALSSLNSSIQSAKVNAYKELGELAKGNPEAVERIPVQTSNVLEAAQQTQSFLDDATGNKVDEVLAEFGLLGKPLQEEGVNVGRKGRFTTIDFGDGDTIKIRGDVKDLNVGNLEGFRQRFNEIFDGADSRQLAAKARIIESIDESSDLLVDGLGESNLSDDIVAAAKKARGIARDQKLTFKQKDLVDDLTRLKTGTVTPVVAASKALDKIKGAPVEDTTKLIKTLQRTGEAGQEAIKNLQAAKVIQLLEGATKSSSKLVREGSEPISDFNGKKFRQTLNDEKALINTLFSNNPEALTKLNRIKTIGSLRITPELAVQKGSAPDLVNSILRSIEKGSAKLPIIGGAPEEAAAKAVAKRESKELRNISLTQDSIEDFIVFNAPRLAVNLGLSGALVSGAAE
jgi:hypothetical protein